MYNKQKSGIFKVVSLLIVFSMLWGDVTIPAESIGRMTGQLAKQNDTCDLVTLKKRACVVSIFETDNDSSGRRIEDRV